MKPQQQRSAITEFMAQVPLLKRNRHQPDLVPAPTPLAPLRRRRHLRRRLVYGLLGLGVFTGVVLALLPAPIPVDLAFIERGQLNVTVDVEGKTRVRERFVVAAPVAGRLSRIDLDAGDRVQKGQLIARIDPLPLDTKVREVQARLRELEAQLAGVETQRPKPEALSQAQAQIQAARAAQRRAEAKVEEAQAALEQARRDRQRAQELESTGAMARQQRENAELLETRRARELEAARHQVNQAIANVAAAQEALSLLQAQQRDPDYLIDVYQAQIVGAKAELANLVDEARRTEVRAPVAGHVMRVEQESARFIQEGDLLLELGDPTQLELVIDVLSADAVQIRPGTSIQIEHWGGDKPLRAKVRYVEPSAFTEVSALGVEEQRVNVIADFINPLPSLGDGYRVETRIVTWQDPDVLKVPLSALFRCEGKAWCTYVVEEGQAQQRQVAIAQRSQFEAVVQKGLNEGDQVILHPTEQITSGQAVSDR